MVLVDLAVEIAILARLFYVLEHIFRGVEAPAWFRRPDAKTDLGFYILNSLINPVFQAISIIGIVMGIAVIGGASLLEVREMVSEMVTSDEITMTSRGMQDYVASLPLWAQILSGLLIADFFGYWGHRIFHKKPFWSLHAIHHSPPALDWLSSARFHPIEDAVMAVLQIVPLLFLGFSPEVFVTVTPIIAVWSVFSHTNVTWDFGPFKYLILTPRFHRWHHTSEDEGLDKNFAGLFPIYDLLFGTWYMPDKVPTNFGAGDEPVPAGFVRQLLYPFRKPKPDELLARDVLDPPSVK